MLEPATVAAALDLLLQGRYVRESSLPLGVLEGFTVILIHVFLIDVGDGLLELDPVL